MERIFGEGGKKRRKQRAPKSQRQLVPLSAADVAAAADASIAPHSGASCGSLDGPTTFKTHHEAVKAHRALVRDIAGADKPGQLQRAAMHREQSRRSVIDRKPPEPSGSKSVSSWLASRGDAMLRQVCPCVADTRKVPGEGREPRG